MTDAQLAALIRPRLAEAIELGRKLEREAQSKTFSDTHELADGAVRPTSFYAGAGFTADDCDRYSSYFSEDDDGYFAADLHRYFGLSVKDFADRSHLVRKQITNKNGNKQWVWVNPDKGKHAGKEDTPARTPEYHPTRDAETAVAKAVNDPHTLTADHLEQLEQHLDVLPRDRLRDLARQVSAKLGKVKADLVANVYAKLKAGFDPSQAPGAALERGYDITVPKGGLEPNALFGRQRREAIAKAAQERGDTPKERTLREESPAPKPTTTERIERDLTPAQQDELRPDRQPAPQAEPVAADREPTLEELETGVRPGGGLRAKHLDPFSPQYPEPEVPDGYVPKAPKPVTPAAPAEQPVNTPPVESTPGPPPEGTANPPAALPSPAPTPAPHTLSKHEAGLAHLAQQRDKLKAGVAAARQHATSATDPQGKAHGDAVAAALQKQLDALSATDDVSRPGAADARREPVYQAYKAGQSQHHVAVEKALKAGQDVPAHVLADYPDLAKKYGKAGA